MKHSTLSSHETLDLEFNLTIYIFQPSCITNLFRTLSFQRAFQQRHHQRQPVTHHPALESSRADSSGEHPHGQPEKDSLIPANCTSVSLLPTPYCYRFPPQSSSESSHLVSVLQAPFSSVCNVLLRLHSLFWTQAFSDLSAGKYKKN